MKILPATEQPCSARQSRTGTFDHQGHYADLLSNRQLKRTFVEGQNLAVTRTSSFRKKDYGTAMTQISGTLEQRLGRLTPVGTLHGNIACHTEHKTKQRNFEQFSLGEPFRVDRQMSNQRDVSKRLVVTDDHVGLVVLQVGEAGDVDSPRIELSYCSPQPAKPPGG